MKSNYIKELKEAVAQLEQVRRRTHDELRRFIEDLHGSKFLNVEGEDRRDWISTNDVVTRLSLIGGEIDEGVDLDVLVRASTIMAGERGNG